MLEVNKQQAAIPELSTVLFNRLGTAPGLWLERDGKVFISLPGVPFEMKEIMISGGFPRLKETFQPPVIVHKVIHTIGVGESFLAEMIKEWEANLPAHIKLAYLPSLGLLKLRLTAKGNNKIALEQELENQTKLLHPYIAPHIFGYDATNLEQAIGQLLIKKALTVATAESCTGGSVASLLTSVSGSSAYFTGSVVAYSNEVKTNLLGVKTETLAAYGAVSEQTVREMAQGIRQKLGASIGIATSGIAGPTGGTPEKPVGTIWIAYSDQHKTITKKLQLTSERSLNVKITTVQVLNLIRENC
jgi:nicotinamide-nucleotide amidase